MAVKSVILLPFLLFLLLQLNIESVTASRKPHENPPSISAITNSDSLTSSRPPQSSPQVQGCTSCHPSDHTTCVRRKTPPSGHTPDMPCGTCNNTCKCVNSTGQ
ncbi:uncharacterized protein LOC129310433 [Prosopis cineraria]|uniref:uncharacterized protein LOC129310433 n=1 Tax=Prosopis cineraria TaxID=364024 RepID=UPI00240E9E57|nr:uncharacterized protein LOC129310433 [Prosopis cineraria]